MQVEMELLQTKAQLGLLQSSASVAATELSTPSTYTKLPNMTEGEDPAAFFLSFEKVACLQGIDESKWARILPSLLNSQMRLHFNRLPMETCTDYRQTKTALMHACRMNAKHYLERFKTMHRSGRQTYAQLLENLKDTFDYYLECKGVNDFISLKDDIILERLRESLAPETRYFVEARKPKTSVELANYADLQFECAIEGRMQAKRDHRPAQKFKSQGAETRESQWGGKPPFNREAQGYKPLEREQGARPMHSWQGSHPQGTGHSYRGNASKINSYGHAHVRFVKPKTKLERVIEYQRQFTIPVYVNGALINALRDSGSQCTLIDAELARGNSSAMNGDPITVQCAFGTVKCFATCVVQISSPNFGTDREITVKAGIIPGLGVKMLIGHDIFVENGDLKDPVAPNKCAMDDDEKPQHAQSLIATRQHDYNDSGPRRGRDEDGSRPVPRRGGVETSPTADELAELRPRERGSKAQVVKPDDDHGVTREAPIVDATPAVIEINHRKGPDDVNDLNDPNEINDQARQSSEDARRQGSHKQDHRRTEVQRAAADATSANNNETQHVSAEEENQMIDGVCGRDQEGDHTWCENGGHQTKPTDAADEFSDSDDHQAAPTEADDENQMVENGDILINDETESFKQAQITDQTLSDLWTAAKEGNGAKGQSPLPLNVAPTCKKRAFEEKKGERFGSGKIRRRKQCYESYTHDWRDKQSSDSRYDDEIGYGDCLNKKNWFYSNRNANDSRRGSNRANCRWYEVGNRTDQRFKRQDEGRSCATNWRSDRMKHRGEAFDWWRSVKGVYWRRNIARDSDMAWNENRTEEESWRKRRWASATQQNDFKSKLGINSIRGGTHAMADGLSRAYMTN